MSRFDYTIQYVEGHLNKVADALSRYHEHDHWEEENTPPEDYVDADARLDREGDDLPWVRLVELKDAAVAVRAMHENNDSNDEAPINHRDYINEYDPTVLESRDRGEHLRKQMNHDDSFTEAIKNSYQDDALFAKILANPETHPAFDIHNGIVWTKNIGLERVLCLPKGKYGQQSIRGAVLEQAHQIVGHFGHQRTADYIRRWYWWPTLNPDTQLFCKTCTPCQTSKTSNQVPAGVLHTLPVPTRPWQSIGMDFIGPFPKQYEYDYLWVVICRLTSMVRLIPVNVGLTATQLSRRYLEEVVRHHGLPESIVSDRDTKFTSKWWRELGVPITYDTFG